MPLLETKGAASAQGFGEFSSSAAVNYIEDVFSTYLYTGNGSTQTITNGIDLSGKGGMLWDQSRSNSYGGAIYDSARGISNRLLTFATNAQSTSATDVTSFNNNGFTLAGNTQVNGSASQTYVSWTFRKQAKFFDVVTYTGTGSSRTVAHNLGSVPGCIIVKRTDTSADWQVYHRSLANTEYMVLNTTAAKATGATRWNSTTPTSTEFSLGTATTVNASGGTYVAYLFAHNAGGFGLEGTDNVISCGSYTGNGSANGPIVTLGYEPQWLLVKSVSNTGGAWQIGDVMRDMSLTNFYQLLANSSSAELNTTTPYFAPTSTGFQLATGSAEVNGNGWSYIYIAIRRGPMKVPTSGTSVFKPVTYTGDDTNERLVSAGFTVDASLLAIRNALQDKFYSTSRLVNDPYLLTSSTDAETTSSAIFPTNIFSQQLGMAINSSVNYGGGNFIDYLFSRAPGFFDVVCYTGTGSYPFTVNHNLGVVPELMIFKKRSANENWWTYAKPLTAPNANWYQNYLVLNTTAARASAPSSMTTSPTSSAITLASFLAPSAATFVVYLFATVAGVSKVGSYTGTGTTQVINCGFTAGSRFVMIKRTDSTGDWYVWDSARGIVAGNDPHLSLNTTAAEVTTDDSVDTDSTGFVVNQLAATNINVTSASYIYLAVS